MKRYSHHMPLSSLDWNKLGKIQLVKGILSKAMKRKKPKKTKKKLREINKIMNHEGVINGESEK